MASILTHADSLREYLTGAGSDGAAQINPSLSLGNFRSSIEAVSLGIEVLTPISSVYALYAGGECDAGDGVLTAVDSNNLTWQPPNGTQGSAVNWTDGVQATRILEGGSSYGSYLRVTAEAPFTPGRSVIRLSKLYNSIFGFDTLTPSQATAGLSHYRATMLRNESLQLVSAFARWIGQLGTQRVSNTTQLSGAGAGSIATSSSLADWPSVGFCQVRSSVGTLKEVVYYTSRTSTTLTVPVAGRGLLGTSATAGVNTDLIYSVPGVAIGIDAAGVQTFGAAIQTIASQATAPIGITWNLGVTLAGGIQIPTINPNQQVGIWVWRHMPAGSVATPSAAVKFQDSFKVVV